MLFGRGWLLPALLVAFLAACGGSSGAPPPSSTPTAGPDLPPTAVPPPTPEALRRDILATRLQIPILSIDAPVQRSRIIPYVDVPIPGCPPRPQDTSTLSVPEQGIATPEEALEGLENKAWIFGHSRWQGRPGLLFTLQDLNPGDEVIVDGVDRATGETLVGQRFVVRALYLTDLDSGEIVVHATTEADIPRKPQVILQTSARQSGHGQQWILDRQKVLAKATNLVEGDLNDPCKYLLLFVVAEMG